ncbi:lasso peptide biosynthesis B2 protein [Streptomyces sp. NPDC048290]|uniref:lasso peptide biosynthesis B2 protein n=1 Tax=Streptomyces sp. NPDC048290 TaxID=3155811 RepID=UPI0034125F29
MSAPLALPSRSRLPVHRRAAPLVAVAVARVLCGATPRRLRRVLHVLRRGAAPATAAQARAARSAVVSVSARAAGGSGCLQRSLATALLCRSRGTWPTWCTGVRTDPFSAHAWVEAGGALIDEPFPPGYYHVVFQVPPEGD